MASETEIRNLRSRMEVILRSQACLAIRFKLDNVGIQTFMYSYIGSAIKEDRVHIRIGSGHGYDHVSNTIVFDSIDVEPPVIVHEATHAIIDATHVGQRITVGAHETAAYLAETLYALNAGDTNHLVDVPHLMGPLYRLARQIKAFNSLHKSGLFTCPPSDTLHIKAVLEHSALRMNVNRTDQMDGINEGPQRGLIRHLWLDSRKDKTTNK